MPSSSPPSITNLSTFLAFAERQEAAGPALAIAVPASVVNEPYPEATGWLYSDRRDSIDVHRDRLGIHYAPDERALTHTPEDRALLQILRTVTVASDRWASTDKPPSTHRIYKAKSQAALYRSHLPVMAELAGRLSRGKAAEAPDGTSSPPSGT